MILNMVTVVIQKCDGYECDAVVGGEEDDDYDDDDDDVVDA